MVMVQLVLTLLQRTDMMLSFRRLIDHSEAQPSNRTVRRSNAQWKESMVALADVEHVRTEKRSEIDQT